MKAGELLNYLGRPVEILSSGKRRNPNPKWGGWIHFRKVRYLDGKQPAADDITLGRLKKAIAMRQTEKTFWQRVAELVDGGMDNARAQEQARAESNKGMLMPTGEPRF